MRIWVRTGAKVRILALGFSSSRPERRGRRKNRGALRGQDPLSDRPDSQGPRPLNQKRQLFPALRLDIPEQANALRLGRGRSPGYSPRPGSGMSTGFPFALLPRGARRQGGGRAHTWRPGPATTARDGPTIGNGFRQRLRIDSPMCKCCSHGTLLHVSPQGSHLSICYYHQDLRRGRLQAGSRPDPSTPAPAPPYSPNHKGPAPPGGAGSDSAVEYRQNARAPSIFRAGCFGR